MRDTTGAAISYAVVSVFPELSEGATTGQAVGTAVTDDDGFWSIPLPDGGCYLIRCEHMAFETCDFFVVVGEETVRLETVLAPSAEYIEAVEVLGVPIRYSAGRYEVTMEGSELARNRVVVVAGFQGLNRSDDITTLGRGGSDTSAVALAAALHADRCQIFTDVEGVFTADPRKIPKATKLKEITFDEMLELASLGAQVLNNRSVELAKKYNVELEVISSINPVPGTVVKEETKVEGMLIKGVAKDEDVAVVSILEVPDVPGMSFKVFSLLAQKNINVDIILQSSGSAGCKDVIFTCSKGEAETARAVLESNKTRFGTDKITVNNDCAKVSIVGAGMQSHPGTASTMFEALYSQNINIHMISTSEIKISVIIDKADADRAVAAIHDAFIQ